ncbi:MAG: PQQ-dependent sugar dehydrogenase [Flavobacteriales bacterium]
MRKSLLLSSAAVLLGNLTPAQVQLELVVNGLNAPVDVAHAGDDRLFVVERPGRIRIVDAEGQLLSQPFLDLTDRVLADAGEQGLLGLAFHPQYPTNGRFYVYYTAGTGNGTLRLSRFNVTSDPNVASTNETILWSLDKPFQNHNGGDLEFGPDGYLYFAPGDGGGAGDPGNQAQNMGVAFGKVLRIDVNGPAYTIPASNPFVGVSGVLPEIWASGLRNPWRFGFDRQTGDLWIGDVGQGEREEVDRWPAGDNSGPNFGWRCYEGNLPYETSGCQPQSSYVSPVIDHPQSDGWCSVIGGRVYRGSLYPSLQGKYIYSDFCHGRVHALQPNGSSWTPQTLISTGSQGVTSIGEDVNGELYFCNMSQGALYHLTDASTVVRVSPKVWLGGAYVSASGDMRDALRTQGLVPATEPYTALGHPQMAQGGGEQVSTTVLNVSNANAVVDWVRVELRSTADPSVIVATSQGLLQRDGDVVAADGSSPLTFHVGPGNYHVLLRHRNHLACMTQAVSLSPTATTIDLRSTATAVWGTNARWSFNGQQLLWPGDIDRNGIVAYTGAENDRDLILQAIGGSIPTNTVQGYLATDVTLDGVVKYAGSDNDRDVILQAIGGTVATNTVEEQAP